MRAGRRWVVQPKSAGTQSTDAIRSTAPNGFGLPRDFRRRYDASRLLRNAGRDSFKHITAMRCAELALISLVAAHRRLAVVGVIAAVCAASAGTFARADSAEDDYKLAVRHYKASRWKLASEAFETYLNRHKGDSRAPFARFYLGLSLENQEQYKSARDAFRSFVKDYPKSENRNDTLFRVAECSYFLNDLKAAEGEFATFLSAAKDHAFAEYALPYLGDAQYRLNKTKEAAATFQRAIEQFPNGRLTDDAKFGLANCQAALNQWDEALAGYRALAERTESSFAPKAQMEMGLRLYGRKEFAEAAAAFDEFDAKFSKRPERSRARLNAGFAYFENGDFEKAVSRFEQAGEDKSLRAQAEYWRALGHKELKQYDKAVAAAKAEFERDAKGEFAAQLLYEWAACERLQNRFAEAGTQYRRFVELFPKHAAADDALQFAAEMALEVDKPDEAQKLLDRFRKEYPKSDLWTYRDILQARVHTAGKDPKAHRSAVDLLQNVVRKTQNPGTKLRAHFYLTRTHRLLDDHKQSLDAAKPLLDDVKKQGADSDYVDVLVLVSRSRLEVKQHPEAIDAASQYLKLRPKSDRVPLMLATRAVAAFRSGDAKFRQTLDDDLDRLLKDFADEPLAGQTAHQLAEAAYQKKDWSRSAELFGKLATLGKESALHSVALLGKGWAEFEAGEFKTAAETFGRLLEDHADDRAVASQAAFKQAECHERDDEAETAAKLYLAAFEKFAPEQAAKRGAEKTGGDHYYTFHAGLAAARTFGNLKKLDEADAAFDKVFAKFPDPDGLDKLLYEWALLNYNADRYKQADRVFRRLVKDRPKSDLADDARYSLAESDLNAGKLEPAKKAFAELHASPQSDDGIKEVSLYRLIGIGVQQEDWKVTQQRAAGFQKQFPNSVRRSYAVFSEAEARFHQNDLKRASELFAGLRAEPADSAAAKESWFPRVWLLSAESALKQRDYNSVGRIVKEANARHAEWPQRYLMDDVLGRTFMRQAKFREAREAFGRVLEDKHARRTETAARCQLLIAESHREQEDFQSARTAYFKVDALYDFPDYQAPALFQAGQCDEKLKEYEGAVKTYEDLIRRFPKSPFAEKAKPRLAAARNQAKRD